MKYIVWVGGSIVYEDNDKIEAKHIGDKYISWGYDDVIIEDIKEEKWKWKTIEKRIDRYIFQ